jgi:hypothetical protein
MELVMSNPTCLWCGEPTEFRPLDNRYECRMEGCTAAHVPVTRGMLEQYPVPCEMEVWVLEYTFGPDDVYSESILADWLGYFANEAAALEAGEKAFATMDNAQRFHWEARPTVLKFEGGVE